MQTRFVTRYIAALIALLTLTATATAQRKATIGLKELWKGFGGNQQTRLQWLAGSGNTMLLATPADIFVIDVSDPAAPHVTDTIHPNIGYLNFVNVRDDSVLVVGGGDGVVLYDIAPRHGFRELMRLASIGNCEYHNGLLFTTHDGIPNDTLSIIDVHDWANPRTVLKVGTLRTYDYFGTLYAIGNYFFCKDPEGNGRGQIIYRLHGTSAPTLLRTWPHDLYIQSMAMIDSVIFTGVQDLQGKTMIRTYSISDDGTISPLHSYDNENTKSSVEIAFSDSRIGISSYDPIVPQFPYSNILQIGRPAADGTITFTDTLRAGWNRDGAGTFHSFYVHDSTVVWMVRSGIRTGRISADGKLKFLGRIRFSDEALDVVSRDRIAFAIVSDRMQVLDCSIPQHPVMLGSLPTSAECIALLSRNRLILADTNVSLVDVSDLAHPRVLSSISLGKNMIVRRIAVRDSTIALACVDHGTLLLTSSADQLKMSSKIPVPGADLLFSNDTLFVVGLDSALTMWRVTSSISPTMIGSPFPLGNAGYSISRMGDTLAIGINYASALFYSAIHSPLPLVAGESFGVGLRDHFLDGFICATNVGGPIDNEFLIYALDSAGRSVAYDRVVIDQDGGYTIDRDLLFVCGGTSGMNIFSIPTAFLGVRDELDRGITEAISCSPNPARDEIAIHYRRADAGYTRISIADLLGNIVYAEGERFDERGEHVRTISRNFPAGKYFVEVHSARGNQIAPLVIER